MQVFHLLYISKAAPHLDIDDLRKIITISNRNNEASDITGALYYRDFYFMQFLEGDEAKVRKLYEKIAKDQRHIETRVIGEVFSNRRLFDTWMSGFADRMPVKKKAEEIFALIELSSKSEILHDLQTMKSSIRLFGNACTMIE
ncbi:MAG: hypothetical protein RJB66_1588 [Pseudomonadota bacterium]|jgi:hypothetical protein